jgi:hypothetical protein
MMNQREAEAYGRRMGCKFYVVNNRGGLLGGFRTRETAEKYKAQYEKELKSNPFCKGEDIRVLIEER